jgi:DnaJ-domain-containing protein 1
MLDDEGDPQRASGGFSDPDERSAWEELEAYMKDGTSTEAPTFEEARRGMPESLRRDFRNLEVPIGAPIDEVRKAYKRQIAAFHPDRHSADPEKLRTATEITKKLNQSFQRIRTYYEEGARAHGAER